MILHIINNTLKLIKYYITHYRKMQLYLHFYSSYYEKYRVNIITTHIKISLHKINTNKTSDLTCIA